MGFLFTTIILLGCDILLGIYLINSQYFSPTKFTGDVDVLNIALFVLLLSLAVGLLVALVIFVAEKLLYCGKKEFPRVGRSLKYGVLTTLVAATLIFLHIFHFLNFFAGLILFALLVIGIMIIK